MLNNVMRKKQLTTILPDILVIICCITSIGFSIIESRLNTDAHHWGLMYANAADLNRGLIPYKEIFIQYGFLTTFIQSLSLNIFGNTVVSVGIITGTFYAANIYLSYCLWRKILNRWSSALSSVVMFLVHGYIVYPWSNYFSYTFLLISLLFLTASPQRRNRYLLSGFFLALSFLARQSLFIIAPIYLYFLLIYISSEQDKRKVHLRNIVMFHVGMLGVIGAFLLYVIRESAFGDWINQSFVIGKFYRGFLHPRNILITLKKIIFPFYGVKLLFYSLIFYNTAVIFIRISLLKKNKGLQEQVQERNNLLFLFSSVILFGYLQAIHIYHVFRLQNSSSLGFGLLIFSLCKLSNRFEKWGRLVLSVPFICLFFYLILFHSTSSVYYPWNRHLVSHQLKQPENIEMLQNKLYDEKTRIYYQTLAKTMSSYDCKLDYLVNFTMNSYIPLLSKSFKRVQRSPFYNEQMSNIIFQDEQEKIPYLFIQEKALLIAAEIKQIPENYQVILEVEKPEIPWIEDKITYIAVPKVISSSCQVKN
ncbi:MAG: glycosyltransferase family 39 protein [Aphanizomenon gracile PMC638.10]|nr:glycosyltransferase family 39 protein [Aphanizomenon gracile PMC638.10]